jgi:dUTPase
MLITGMKIIEDQLLENAIPKNIKGGCYYLRIHSIIPAGEEAKSYDSKKPKTFHTLEPGGMAWVISEEKFAIKVTSVTALVTLRSGFTKKGMLALDVGLVDVNFSGPIGTMVINFSKVPIRLNAGEDFFRVVFLEHEEVSEPHVPKPMAHTHEEYIRKTLTDSAIGFPSSFLQTSEMEARIRDSLKSDLTEKLEPELLDALGQRFFANNWGKMLSGAIMISIAGIAGLNSYLYTPEDIQKIVDQRLEELGILNE